MLLALIATHNVGDPFKACVDVVHLHAITLRDSPDGLGRDDRFNDILPPSEPTCLFPSGEEIVDVQDGVLIAV